MLVNRVFGVRKMGVLLQHGLPCLVFLMAGAVTSAAEILVPSQQPTIQAGIDAASDGDTVIVANGTYTGVGNRDIDFSGKAITVRSAGGAANCIIDCEGLGRGFFFQSRETAASIVQGFTITNGDSTVTGDPVNWHSGGGMMISGDGVADKCSPTVLDCVFTKNKCLFYGAGLFMGFSDSVIANCIFTKNTATSNDSLGGGLAYAAWSRPVVTGCSFVNNRAAYGGGVTSMFGSTSTLLNCRFVGNVAVGGLGGGWFVRESHVSQATNCLFVNNEAAAGGAVYSSADTVWLTNCTVVGNRAGYHGGLINGAYAGAPVGMYVTNCIVRDNVGFLYEPDQEMSDWGASPISVTYSNIKGGYAGVGNIDADPLFVNAAAGDLHLQPGSPCVNTGLNSAVTTAKDLDGNDRILGDIVDMGAYEAEASSLVVEKIQFKRAGINEQVKFVVRNDGTQSAVGAKLTSATLGSVAANQKMPLDLGTIPAGGSVSVTLIFRVPAGTRSLAITGTSTLGTFMND